MTYHLENAVGSFFYTKTTSNVVILITGNRLAPDNDNTTFKHVIYKLIVELGETLSRDVHENSS